MVKALAVCPEERRMRRSFFFLAVGLAGLTVMSSLASDSGAGPGRDEPARFTITTRREDDRVEVRGDQGKTVFTVRSPFGISRATIERVEDEWPKAVVLRLNLKGLERFTASNGKVTVDAAVSIREGKAEVRVWKDGKEEAPLDAKDPLWMDVRILGDNGKPAKELPLTRGHFEIVLPKALFEGNPKSITVSWIDFYRG
jgi:hypothetical protein